MNPDHLRRLQEEQRKAIGQTQERIDQCEKFKSDYKALQDRLKTLPDKMTHDIMVPFGKLAFMPGKMVHTNEILVLLGDNWFAEQSAKQAADIAGRRIEALDKTISDLNEEKKLLEPRLGFTTDMQAELQDLEGVKEITEEYNEEKEKLWDEQHRKNVRRHKERLQLAREEQSQESSSAETLWSRLDELEKQEAERGEISSEDDERNEERSSGEKRVSFDKRRVSWADEKFSDGPECADDSDDEFSEEDCVKVGKTITFSHTKTSVAPPHHITPSGDMSITSPADLYKLFAPSSILKKTMHTITAPDLPQSSVSQPEFADTSSARSCKNFDAPDSSGIVTQRDSGKKAFTGKIVEHESGVRTDTHFPVDSSVHTAPDDPPQRVSKFKAQRMRHNQS